jgi:hypothetical protein
MKQMEHIEHQGGRDAVQLVMILNMQAEVDACQLYAAT